MTTKKVFWAGNQSELSLFISDYSDSTYTDRVELIKKVFSKQRSPQCESAFTFQFFTRPNPIWLDPLREVIEDSKSYNSALDPLPKVFAPIERNPGFKVRLALLALIGWGGHKFRLAALFVAWGARSPHSSRLALRNFCLARYTHILLAMGLDLYGCILGIKNSLGRVERRYETWAKSFQNGKETSRMPCKLHSDLVKLNLQNDLSNILGGGLDASRLQLAVCQNWLFCKPRRAKRP
jgi:hypothetical protein